MKRNNVPSCIGGEGMKERIHLMAGEDIRRFVFVSNKSRSDSESDTSTAFGPVEWKYC